LNLDPSETTISESENVELDISADMSPAVSLTDILDI